MATIECNEISQTINQLLTTWSDDCKKINSSDLTLLVQLIAAVRECNEGGPLYNTLISDNYEPISDQIVTYPIDTFHSLNILVLEGKITRIIDSAVVEFSAGTVLRFDVSSLNQTSLTFTVLAGSHVIVDYLIETV